MVDHDYKWCLEKAIKLLTSPCSRAIDYWNEKIDEKELRKSIKIGISILVIESKCTVKVTLYV